MSVNEKKSIGISISDRSIEVLELVKKDDNFDISHIGRKEFSADIVESGMVVNPKLLKSLLLDVFKESVIIVEKYDNVNFAIPEAQVYTHIFEAELKNQDEENLVEEELLDVVPLKKKDLLFKYKKNKINHKAGLYEFLALSVDRNVFLEWTDFFKSLGIKVNNFHFESLASFYGLFLDLPKNTCALLDMGARTSNLSIFVNQKLKYSYGIRIGGEYFTKKISEGLKISFEKAEELKFNYGLTHPANKLYNEAFLKALEHLKIEIQRNVDYFKKNYSDDDSPVGELYLLGGSSKILGIKDYFEHLSIFENIKIGEPFVDLNGKTEFIEALGLAMSFFSLKEKDFVFKLGEEKKKIKINNNFKNFFNFDLKITSKKKKDPIISHSKTLESKTSLDLFSPEKRKLFLKSFLKYFLVFCLSFLFFFLVTTSFSNNNKIPEDNIQEPELFAPVIVEPEIEEKKVNKIKIKDIVDALNIREGAGTNYSVVGKASPGEEYVLLLEEGDWQKIELENKLWGWVHGAYTEKIED